MEKRRCELCGEAAATMYCESDAAILCLRCDEKVNGANFIVAKHERSLLCNICQSVTAWKASGLKLGRTVSVCDGCVCERNNEDEAVDVESRDRSDGDDEPDGSSDDEEEEEEVEDNQVVPWSSSEEGSSSSICGRELKRRRDVADLDSDGEIEDGGGSSSMDCDRSRSTFNSNSAGRIEPECEENQTDNVQFSSR